MERLYILSAAALVGVIVWYLMSQKSKSDLVASQSELNQQLASIQARYEALEESRENDKSQHEENAQMMKQAFNLAARQAFDEVVEKAEKDKESSFSSATELLSNSMKEYMENIQRMERDSIERSASLSKEIGQVSDLGMELSRGTENLTNALRADSQKQGAWGELVLENMLQGMGFVEGKDYQKQTGETAEDGSRLRTDFIIQLPDNRHIIIDSKVSLKAWDQYVNADDEDAAEIAMKKHCSSIRNHAKTLSDKNYTHMESVNSPDFVLMFVPLESAYGAAMRMSPELYRDLTGNVKVKVVTGATIVTALMLIQDLWKREQMTTNQRKLIETAGGLHDKIAGFLKDFKGIGFELKQASQKFEEAETKLISGTGNVVRRTNQLKGLGAKVKKELPESYLTEATFNDGIDYSQDQLTDVSESE
ncbi:MAG TPA: DNA recombination protein RmuC [Candidatus Poseidoniales archaeon]|nr:DNA recombination protein RmuC [Candidatus Poseidoniales archaeon]